jgi:hypothetical protein
MTSIWLGVETDDQGRICTVALTGSPPWTHPKTLRYKNIHEFQETWKGELDRWSYDYLVALDYYEYARRSTPVGDWLSTRGEIAIEYFNFPSLYGYFEPEVSEIPDTFRKAYVLAMCAYYRGTTFQVARELLLEVYGLQRRLQRLEDNLNRLAYTLPPPRKEPTALYCPF